MRSNARFATFLILAAAPLAVMAAESKAGAAASTTQLEVPPLFKELDKNRDGQIDQSEARKSADVKARFSALDADKDKLISLAEWQAGEQAKAGGAAGVSGESRDRAPAAGQSPTGKPGEGLKPLPDKY